MCGGSALASAAHSTPSPFVGERLAPRRHVVAEPVLRVPARDLVRAGVQLGRLVGRGVAQRVAAHGQPDHQPRRLAVLVVRGRRGDARVADTLRCHHRPHARAVGVLEQLETRAASGVSRDGPQRLRLEHGAPQLVALRARRMQLRQPAGAHEPPREARRHVVEVGLRVLERDLRQDAGRGGARLGGELGARERSRERRDCALDPRARLRVRRARAVRQVAALGLAQHAFAQHIEMGTHEIAARELLLVEDEVVRFQARRARVREHLRQVAQRVGVGRGEQPPARAQRAEVRVEVEPISLARAQHRVLGPGARAPVDAPIAHGEVRAARERARQVRGFERARRRRLGGTGRRRRLARRRCFRRPRGGARASEQNGGEKERAATHRAGYLTRSA